MRSLLQIAYALFSVCMVASGSQLDHAAELGTQLGSTKAEEKRPIYAIAHMVLEKQGVKDALRNGANSLEVDLTAWDKWFADHDGTADSAGDTAKDLFKAIADERESGKNITFVWLDIKNPDYCAANDKDCGITALRDLSRDLLEPAGVRVLYGFYGTRDSDAYEMISKSLNKNEAVVLSGEAEKVLDMYSSSSLPTKQRILDHGYTRLEQGFGDCKENGYYTCSELRQAVKLRNQCKFGKVFSWTSTAGDDALVEDLLGIAGVDGIIYGLGKTRYRDNKDTQTAAKDITSWVAQSCFHRMATNDDEPW